MSESLDLQKLKRLFFEVFLVIAVIIFIINFVKHIILNIPFCYRPFVILKSACSTPIDTNKSFYLQKCRSVASRSHFSRSTGEWAQAQQRRSRNSLLTTRFNSIPIAVTITTIVVLVTRRK